MKNIFHKLGTLALLSSTFLFTGCDPEFEEDRQYNAGTLDLSKYIAVGNSLTAGFQDDGLYREGQLFSYPNILANQFYQVGGGDFIQPLFSNTQFNGSGFLYLSGFSSAGTPVLTRVTGNLAVTGMGADGKTPLLARYTDQNIQNFGVPGIKLADINTAGYGLNNPAGFNPYFERLLPENSSQTYLQRISGQQPTFFSAWLGNNDVLGYAVSGGFANSQINPTNQITPTATFESLYTELINTLSTNNTEGIVATIPDVRSIPFFTTVGPSAKALLAARSVPAFFALTKASATRKIILRTDLKDSQGGTVLLPLTSSAYLPLFGTATGKYWRDLAMSQNPTNSNAALAQYLMAFDIDTTQAFGTERNPIPSTLVLDADEQAEINTATIAFNNVIKAQATAKNLAIFDAYTYFNSIQGGFMQNGVAYSPTYITGNLFSLDGVHPTPRGYAIIANEMIKAINMKYGASIPTIDVTRFRTVQFP